MGVIFLSYIQEGYVIHNALIVHDVFSHHGIPGRASKATTDCST